jgi:hypothetical protein
VECAVPIPLIIGYVQAGLSLTNVSVVEIVGGGVRVPKVQTLLKEYLAKGVTETRPAGSELPCYSSVWTPIDLSCCLPQLKWACI